MAPAEPDEQRERIVEAVFRALTEGFLSCELPAGAIVLLRPPIAASHSAQRRQGGLGLVSFCG
jgi:hypothetical protein